MTGKHYVRIKGQRLNEYCYNTGGGMMGGYYKKTIKRYDDKNALISIESVAWHNQDAEVKEYFADISIMDELEEVIRDCRMNFWHRKKFTDIFISDGESRGYHFTFDNACIDFSSQFYPDRYREKLNRFNEVIEKYIKDARELPGLVSDKNPDNGNIMPSDGRVDFYVYLYCNNNLYVRVLNGTAEMVSVSLSYKVINSDTGKLIAEKEDKYSTTAFPRSKCDLSFSIKQRLDIGRYKLVVNNTEIPFEIK